MLSRMKVAPGEAGHPPIDAGEQNAKGESQMSSIYPQPTPQTSRRRRELAPAQLTAFEEFSKVAFADGALAAKTKQIVAVAIAHVTQCPYCIRGHTRAGAGATEQELMEAIWVAAEMRAGGAYAHSSLMLAAALEQSEQAARR